MDVRDYFEFIDETSIRIKGHRIYIDEVLEEHLQGKEPEEILCCFPRLPLEKIYATLLYYEANKAEVELQDYFDFNSEIDIRIKGHRIAIQHVLNRYRDGSGVEELHRRFPTLSMEKIYATILYYLTNKSEVEVYLERERLMDEETGKLIKMYGRTPTLINWEERLEAARQN